MSNIIVPTVGRIVYFFEAAPNQVNSMPGIFTAGPLAAVVTQVHSNTCINVAVHNANGSGTFGRTSVRLVHPGEQAPKTGMWCELKQISETQRAQDFFDGVMKAQSQTQGGSTASATKIGERVADGVNAQQAACQHPLRA